MLLRAISKEYSLVIGRAGGLPRRGRACFLTRIVVAAICVCALGSGRRHYVLVSDKSGDTTRS